MTSEVLTCPYCNASIGVPPGVTAGQQILCPRCGDAFPLRFVDSFTGRPPLAQSGETAITTDAPPAVPPLPVADVSLRSRRSNRLIAGMVLGVMLVMAGSGLAFMLMTTGERRAHDTSRPPRRPGRQRGVPEPDTPPIATVSPDKLAALGYLPSGVNFLIGVRIIELLASPAGMQVLRDPIKFGEGEYRLESLPAWVGLRLEDIDHLVFAARVDDALIPPFYLVLRTNRPYDDEATRQRLRGTRVASPSKKKLYSFRRRQNGLPLHVWFADENTLVLALLPAQLESLPSKPVEDLRQLPDEVRTVLKTRREPVAPVWIVGHSRDWSKTTVGKFLNRLKKEDLERLAPLQTFGLWLVPDKSLDIRGVFECKDAAAARGLEDYFRSLRGGNDPNFKTALDGPWLTLQFQTDPKFLSRILKR
ncbi:MAG TPA: hypothetical protein VH682_05405 [Gemmataceae bacterium]|jgi:hypothetical protein